MGLMIGGAFIARAFKQSYVYRTNVWIAFVRAILGLLIAFSVWTALYRGVEHVNGITYADMVQYVIINSLVTALVGSSIAQKLGQRVADGTIGNDLIKPFNVKWYLVSEQIGENLFRLVFSTVPAAVVAVLVYGFGLPAEPYQLLLFALSLLLGIVIMFYFHLIVGTWVFWIKTSFYIDWLSRAVFTLFAGTVVPIWFYPPLLQHMSYYLPFRLVSFEPIAIYIGKHSWASAWQVIAVQAGWIVLFVVLERWLWRKAQDQVVVHGG